MSKIIMNADRKNRKIKINTPPNAKVETNADETIMKGVQEKSSGGEISHNAKNKLEQVGNIMSATNKGKIINKSDGNLNQTDNIMTTKNKGEIQNIVQQKKDSPTVNDKTTYSDRNNKKYIIGLSHFKEDFNGVGVRYQVIPEEQEEEEIIGAIFVSDFFMRTARLGKFTDNDKKDIFIHLIFGKIKNYIEGGFPLGKQFTFTTENTPVDFETALKEQKIQLAWRRAKKIKNEHQNKFLIIDGKRYEIANPPTRNILGYNEGDFVYDEINNYAAGEINIDLTSGDLNIYKIYNNKTQQSDYYLQLKHPYNELRLIPDEATFTYLHSKGSKIINLELIEEHKYPKGLPLEKYPPIKEGSEKKLSEEKDIKYDVFIAHANEDKQFAIELVEELEKHKITYWLDSLEITLGDSVRERIDSGLLNSSYGVVVLSKIFFTKSWTIKELNALFAKEKDKKVILPIWHEIDRKYIEEKSLLLADKYAARTDTESVEEIANKIAKVIKTK
ncbi:toll/interleukin-1 receptor domain-containing protein [Patescibacteria group bacterium]|nr:toll/interleukin-1 receptor domain-containing protein [Patescibacteria group bacterium]